MNIKKECNKLNIMNLVQENKIENLTNSLSLNESSGSSSIPTKVLIINVSVLKQPFRQGLFLKEILHDLAALNYGISFFLDY